jgi:CHAD domain-containing protein
MPDSHDINLYKALSKPYNIILKAELELSPSGDPEVLHQFRVAIRRIRSLLTLIRSESDIEIDNKLIKILKRVASFSNQIRDLDVMLSYLRDYEKFSEITDIYAIFEQMQIEKINQFIILLKTDKTITKISKKLTPLLDTLKSDENSFPPDHVLSSLLDNFTTVEQKYGALLNGSDREIAHLHNFRKECKKLRYQGEVLDNEAVDNLVQHCKKIQTILGNLHDCNVWISQIGSVDSENGKEELIHHLGSQKNNYLDEFEEYISAQFNDSVRENIKRSLTI